MHWGKCPQWQISRLKVYVNQLWHLFFFLDSFFPLLPTRPSRWDLQMFRVWKLGGRSPAPDGSGHFGKLNEKLLCGDEKAVCQLSEEEGTSAACSRKSEVTKVYSHFPWHLLSIIPGGEISWFVSSTHPFYLPVLWFYTLPQDINSI